MADPVEDFLARERARQQAAQPDPVASFLEREAARKSGAATPSAAPAPSLVPPPVDRETYPAPLTPDEQRTVGPGRPMVNSPLDLIRAGEAERTRPEREAAENEAMAAQGFRAKGGGSARQFVPMSGVEMAGSAMGSAIREPMRQGWEKAGREFEKGNATGTLRGLIQSGVGAVTSPFAPAAATSNAIAAADADPSLPKVGGFGRTLGFLGEAPALPFKPIAAAKGKLAEAQAAAEATGYPGLAKTMEVAGLGTDVAELYLGAKIPAMERAIGGRVSRFAQDYAAAKALRAEAAPAIAAPEPVVSRMPRPVSGEPVAVPPAEATPPVKPGAFGEQNVTLREAQRAFNPTRLDKPAPKPAPQPAPRGPVPLETASKATPVLPESQFMRDYAKAKEMRSPATPEVPAPAPAPRVAPREVTEARVSKLEQTRARLREEFNRRRDALGPVPAEEAAWLERNAKLEALQAEYGQKLREATRAIDAEPSSRPGIDPVAQAPEAAPATTRGMRGSRSPGLRRRGGSQSGEAYIPSADDVRNAVERLANTVGADKLLAYVDDLDAGLPSRPHRTEAERFLRYDSLRTQLEKKYAGEDPTYQQSEIAKMAADKETARIRGIDDLSREAAIAESDMVAGRKGLRAQSIYDEGEYVNDHMDRLMDRIRDAEEGGKQITPRRKLEMIVREQDRLYTRLRYQEGRGHKDISAMTNDELVGLAKRYLDDGAEGFDGPEPIQAIIDQIPTEFPKFKPRDTRSSGMRRRGEGGAVNLTAVRDVARAGEGLLDRADTALGERVTGPVVDKALDVIPGARKLEQKVLRTEEAAISPEFEQTIRAGESMANDLQYESNVAMANLRKATKGLPEPVLEEIGKSLSSEPANLAMVPDEVIPFIEAARTANQNLRTKMVEAGALKPVTFEEYPQGHLARVLKPDTLKQRFQNWRGGVKLDESFVARDMPSVNPKMSEAEIRALIPEGAPVRSINPQGGRTLVKFDNTPEGLAARDALVENIKARMAGRRANVGALATEAIREGDVRQAKMLSQRQADIPTAADLDIQSMDPIPPDVAKRIFMSDTIARMKVTTEQGARAVATRNTQKALSVLRDKDGPIAIEPADRGAAARGIEKPPAGYEVLTGEQYGELNGMFVRENAAKYIKGAFTPEATNFGKDFGRTLMSHFKSAVLLPAPRQWFRQFVSNLESENLAGMSFWNPRWVQHKMRGLAAMRTGSRYYRELVAEGFLDPSFVSAEELGLMEAQFRGNKRPGVRLADALGTFGLSEVAPGALNTMKAKLSRGFSAADAWTKSSIYTLAREEMGMNHQQAAAYTRKWTHDARQASPFAKYWSTNLLGDPWVRFKTNQTRINLDGLREKPIRLAMNRFQTTMMKGALAALGIAMLSEDEDEALKNEQGGGALAVGRDEQLRPVAIDYSFLGTTGDFDSRPETIGKPWRDALETGKRWSGVGDNPLLSTVMSVAEDKDYRGRPLNPGGTISGGVAAVGKTFFGNFVPNLAKSGKDKLRAALEDKPYSPNAPKQTVEQAVLDVFFGFKLTPLDAQRALEKIARQGEFAMRDLETEFNKNLAEGRAIDEAEVRARANAIAEQFKKRAEPLKKVREQQSGRGIPLETVK